MRLSVIIGATIALVLTGAAGGAGRSQETPQPVARALTEYLSNGQTRDRYLRDLADSYRRVDPTGDGLTGADIERWVLTQRAGARADTVKTVLMQDLDGDREVTRAEALRSAHARDNKYPGEKAEALFGQYDLNDDSRITMAEAAASAPALHQRSMAWIDSLRTIDPDRDGVLTLDELLAAGRRVFDGADSNRDGIADGVRYPTQVPPYVPRACTLPHIPEGAKLVQLAVQRAAAVSTISVGEWDSTGVVDITIEPGDQPLYLLLSSQQSMVWRLAGATDRVAQAVVFGSASWQRAAGREYPGIARVAVDPRISQPSTARRLVSAAAVSGAPASKVVAVETYCGRTLFSTNAGSGAGSEARKPDAVFSGNFVRAATLPSGEVTQADSQAAAVPRGFDPVLWRTALKQAPGGVVEVDPDTLVAATRVARDRVLPGYFGLSQLVGKGDIERSGDRYRIVRPLPRMPARMALGDERAALWLAKGVPLPPGPAPWLCIIPEESGNPLELNSACPEEMFKRDEVEALREEARRDEGPGKIEPVAWHRDADARFPEAMIPFLTIGSDVASAARDLRVAIAKIDRDGEGLTREDIEVADQLEAAERRASGLAWLIRLDVDGDSSVSRAEVSASIDRSNASEFEDPVDALFDRSDANDDGVITPMEAMTAADTSDRRPGLPLAELLSLDPDHDGTLTSDEFDLLIRRARSYADSDGNGMVSPEESEALSTRSYGVREDWQMRDCKLPRVPEGASLITYNSSSYTVSTATIGGQGEDTRLTDLTIEPGETPLYLMLHSSEAMIWRLHGATDRVTHLVVSSRQRAWPKTYAKAEAMRGRGKVLDQLDRVSAAGVIGLSPERITITDARCRTDVGGREGEEHDLILIPLRFVVGHPLDGIFYGHGRQVSLPSGKGMNVSEKQGALPPSFDADTWREAVDHIPTGFAPVDAGQVIARARVEPYQILPKHLGLAQLIGSGAMEKLGKTRFRIVRPIPRLPADFGSLGSANVPVVLILAPGVPVPPGAQYPICVIDEATGKLLSKLPKCEASNSRSPQQGGM